MGTAVASNSTWNATTKKKEEEQENLEKNRQKFIRFLKQVFEEADEDKNGVLDKEEFTALLQKEMVHEQMRTLGVHLTQEELMAAWETLDYRDSGEVGIEEFVDGLSFLQEGLSTKHIVRIDYALRRCQTHAEERLKRIKDDVNAIIDSSAEVLKRLKDQGEA